MKPKDFFYLIRDSVQAWSLDGATRQAAALAYYSIFSLAPLLAMITLLVGRLLRNWFTTEEVLARFLEQIAENLDPQTAAAIADIAAYFLEPSGTLLGTLVNLGIILYAGSNLLAQLQLSLDIVWHVAPDPQRNVARVILKDRALAFGFIGLLGLLLIATFLVNTFLNAVGAFLAQHVQETVRIFNLLDPLITFVSLTIIFALVFKVLPRVKISWRDVWIGALVTAVLFMIAIKGLSFYFTTFARLSAYGAAGSLVLILLWVYFSAQIFLFGAEFTKVYANRFGSQIRPNRGAIYRLPVTSLPRSAEIAPTTTSQPVPVPPAVIISPVMPDLPELANDRPRLPYAWLLATAIMLLLGILLGGQRRH